MSRLVKKQLNSLEKLLFGEEKNAWWKSFDYKYHARNILELVKYSDGQGLFAVKNAVKALPTYGLKNLIKYLSLQFRIVDEMKKINERKGMPNISYANHAVVEELEDSDEQGMSSYERFNRAVDLKEADRVPICFLMDYYIAANNGLSPRQFLHAPLKTVFTAVKNTYERFGGALDMVHFPMGRLYAYYNTLPLGPSGFFNELVFPDKVKTTMQFVDKSRVTVNDFEKIKKHGVRCLWRPVNVKKVFETQKDIINLGAYFDYWENQRKVPLYATSGITTPLEGLCYLMGFKNWSRAVVQKKHREQVKQVCDFMLEGTLASKHMMNVFSQVDRTYVCLESVSAEFLRPQIFEELVLDNLLTIVKDNVKHGLTTVFHMDTDWTPFFHYFKLFPKNGKYILHLEDSDIFKAKQELGDKFCIMGNIPTKMLAMGTREQVRDYTMKLLEECKEDGGYMMAEGCEVAPNTPFQNLKTVVDTTLKHGTY